MGVASAVGQSLTLWGNKGTIVGVVKDFNFKPVQSSIAPLILRYNPGAGKEWLRRTAVVSVPPARVAGAIDELRGVWNKMNPAYDFGIRKVLGANVTGIVAMLSKGFVRLVLIATLIASPLAWYIMQRWLQDFAYRITISGWVFAGAGMATLLIALFTVSFQAIKAAVANPVKSLQD
jgi:putative ABC transport system permease protein